MKGYIRPDVNDDGHFKDGDSVVNRHMPRCHAISLCIRSYIATLQAPQVNSETVPGAVDNALYLSLPSAAPSDCCRLDIHRSERPNALSARGRWR